MDNRDSLVRESTVQQKGSTHGIKNKVIVVTGAGRGKIGRGLATFLAGKGANIAVVDPERRRHCHHRSTVQDAGVNARGYKANVAQEADVEKLFSDVAALTPVACNGLINNAGITRDGLLVKFVDGKLDKKMGLQQWQAVIGRLTGVFLCGREAAAR